MYKRISIALGLLFGASLLIAAFAFSSHPSDFDLSQVRGGQAPPPCQYGVIDLENTYVECHMGPSDCDFLGCTDNSEKGCDSGKEYANVDVPYYVVAGTDCDWFLNTAHSVTCFQLVQCKAGALDPDKTCFERKCETPDPGTEPTGCKTCSKDFLLGFPDSIVMPRYDPCPCGDVPG